MQITNYLSTVALLTADNKQVIFEDIVEGSTGFAYQVTKEYS